MNMFSPNSAKPDSTPLTSQTVMELAQAQFHRFWHIFRRRFALFAVAVVTVVLISLLITMQAKPMYTATSSVMLDTRTEQVTGEENVLSGLPPTSPVVDTEVEVLRSRQLAERVIKALELDKDPEFNGALRKPSGLKALTSGFKNGIKQAKPGSAPPTEAEQQKRHERIVDAVLGRLSIRRAGLTYIINVSFASESPEKAAAISNQFAQLYLREQLQAKFDATVDANKWLNGRLSELRTQVMEDDAAVQQYKISNNLMSAGGASLTEQEISTYNQTLAQARAQLAEDTAKLETARRQLASGSTGDDVAEALSSPVVQQYRAQRAVATRKVAELSGKYGDRHPEMLKAQRELSDIDNNIREEIQRVVSNLEAKVLVSRQRVDSMAGSLGGARNALVSNNRATVRLNELERTAQASKTLYEGYLARFKEVSGTEALQKSDARILSKAAIPTGQSSPKIQMSLILGLVAGIAVGLALVILVEILDAGLATADDVERRLHSTYLGAIPLASSVGGPAAKPVDYVVSKPLSAFAEAFRNLRTSVQYLRVGQPVKVIAITSSLPGEGKTTSSICLGRSIALQGLKVIVVEADLRRRALHRALGVNPELGLLEVLSGEATLESAVILDEETGAHFLPLAKAQVTPKDVFGSEVMDRLLAELRMKYDVVLLDTAPVLPVADTRVLAAKADATIFLVRWRKTPQHAVEAAFRLLKSAGGSPLGVALTQVDMRKQARYGYGDPGYYYSEYKKYYAS